MCAEGTIMYLHVKNKKEAAEEPSAWVIVELILYLDIGTTLYLLRKKTDKITQKQGDDSVVHDYQDWGRIIDL